jgi:ribonuclease HI
MEPTGIFERRMNFSPYASNLWADRLYQVCGSCDQYLCLSDIPNQPRFDYPVVFTDGACSNNGYHGATSGIGGAFGDLPEYQWSIHVDNEVDDSSVRTNQRAELLAAIEGVRRLGDFLDIERPCGHATYAMVVATDSEYVCKGVTEWMPRWKVCCSFFPSSEPTGVFSCFNVA